MLKRIIGKYTSIHTFNLFCFDNSKSRCKFLNVIQRKYNTRHTQQIDEGIYNGLYAFDDVYPANPHQTASIISRQKGSN